MRHAGRDAIESGFLGSRPRLSRRHPRAPLFGSDYPSSCTEDAKGIPQEAQYRFAPGRLAAFP